VSIGVTKVQHNAMYSCQNKKKVYMFVSVVKQITECIWDKKNVRANVCY